MPDATFQSTLRLVWIALCAALIVAGAFLPVLTLGPVPITFQTMFVILAGLVLGPYYGPAAVGLYLLAGAFGLPVFAKGGSGFAYFAGPTGGFLIGFLLCAFVCGLLNRSSSENGHRGTPPLWKLFVFSLAGLAPLYIIGLAWLKISLGMDWLKTLSVGLLPFIPGALIKCALAGLIYRYLERWKLIRF